MMKRLAALAATIALVLAGEAGAAEWPIKPIKIVVAYAADGANDLLARAFAERGEDPESVNRLFPLKRQALLLQNTNRGRHLFQGFV
jgi:hypothetical protein